MVGKRNFMWCLALATLLLLAATAEVQALPDLVITELDGPSVAKIGEFFNVTITVKNQGNTSAGPFRVVIYFSTDTTITTSDFLIGYYWPLDSLAPGDVHYFGCPMTACIWTPSIQPGTYYLGAIIDDENAVAESNENNNARVADTGPVLITTSGGPETVSKPTVLTGPASGTTGISYQFMTGGSASSLGATHQTQYLFNWGDGTDSGWLPVGVISASKSWSSNGTFPVKAQARCSVDPSIISSWSDTLNVAIGAAPPAAPWVLVDPPTSVGATWYLTGVDFTSPSDGWAVGRGGTFDTRGDILLHNSGGAWTSLDPASVSHMYILSGVDFTSSSEGWAVGRNDTPSSAAGIAIHYSGGNWTTANPPAWSTQWQFLGVHFPSPAEGWAVGEETASHSGIIVHYSGGAWSFASPPVTKTLNGVYFTSPGEGWAVGGVDGGVLLHYSGGNWSAVTAPSVSANWRLSAVHFTSPDEGWAAGGDDTNHRGVLLHYSGGNWTAVAAPSVSSNWKLSAVHFTSPDEGWAVGRDNTNQRGVLLHYSAGKWTNVTPPAVSANWELAGVHFTSAGEGWAVGSDFANHRGVLLHYLVQTYSVTVNTNPAGLRISVNGIEHIAPKTFQWPGGAVHTFSAPSPQSLPGQQYVFSSWSDGGGQTHDVTVPSQDATYTAHFTVQSESVSAPAFLTGPTTGAAGVSYSYSAGGSTSTLGHDVEYQFDWKGDASDTSSWGFANQSKVWAQPGAYSVRARARCSTHTSIVSGWSNALSVNISSTPPNGPDLTAEWVGNVTEKCTGTGNRQKCKITGKLKVKSDGNQDVSTSTYVDFYLQGDVQDTLIKRTKVGKLKKGKSTVLTITWTSPAGKSAKGKYIYARVDADDTVDETDENNNKIYFNNIL